MKILKIIVDKLPDDMPCYECPFYHRPFTEDDSTCTLCEMLGIEDCILDIE